MADARDLKSLVRYRTCGFNSHPRHQISDSSLIAHPSLGRYTSWVPLRSQCCSVVSRYVSSFVGLIVLLIVAWLLKEKIGHVSCAQLVRGFLLVPSSQIVAAILLTACSYTLLTGYDYLALHCLRQRLPYRLIALASFTAYAFAHNVGFPLISSSTIRIRMYRKFGVSLKTITVLVALCCFTYWLGYAAIAGFIFTVHPQMLAGSTVMSATSLRICGILLLLALAATLSWVAASRGVRVGRWHMKPLPLSTMLFQMSCAALEIVVSAGILSVLLPPPLHFIDVLGIFLIAQVAGLASQVPGGIGVFEATVLLFLPQSHDPADYVGALLLYRTIYYLLPLAVAFVFLLLFECRGKCHTASVTLHTQVS